VKLRWGFPVSAENVVETKGLWNQPLYETEIGGEGKDTTGRDERQTQSLIVKKKSKLRGGT